MTRLSVIKPYAEDAARMSSRKVGDKRACLPIPNLYAAIFQPRTATARSSLTNLDCEIVAPADYEIRVECDAAHEVFVCPPPRGLCRLSGRRTTPASLADNRGCAPEPPSRHGRLVSHSRIGRPALEGRYVEESDMLIG